MREKLELIQKTGVNYFNDFTNLDYESKGFGLTIDNTDNLDRASIASTGYALSSYIIADKHGYIGHDELVKRVIGTLKTLYYNVDHYEGFFAHFVNIKTGKKHGRTEYSTIDTALALNGVIACEQYFNNEEITKYAELLINRVNWRNFFHLRNGKLCLHMAYNDDAKGDYAEGKPGYIHHWSMFAEQLMMYVMIAGNDSYTSEEALELYNNFERLESTYEGKTFYYSPGNTLFIYQYPLLWLDLKNVYDNNNVSWFENARLNTLTQYDYSINGKHNFKTLGKKYFGMTASDSPTGYRVSQSLPNVNNKLDTDGTVAPNAIIGSLIFTPNLALEGINQMFLEGDLWNDKYGFVDAFNFENERWTSSRYISIDKGTEMLMANAYLYQDVQNAYMSHPVIKKGMEKLLWKKTNGGKNL